MKDKTEHFIPQPGTPRLLQFAWEYMYAMYMINTKTLLTQTKYIPCNQRLVTNKQPRVQTGMKFRKT